MSRDTYSSVSSNTVRNFSIGLHRVPQHVQTGMVSIPSWMSKPNRAAPDGHERELERV